VAAATATLGTPVADAVPLARRRHNTAAVLVACLAVAFFVAVLYGFGAIPGPKFPLYFVGPASIVVFFQLTAEPVFAAQTRDGGIWMLTGSRMSPRPLTPIGPLDTGHVSGPVGLLRNTFRIAGIKHQVGVQHKARFQRMLAAASVGESGT
jgi:hypothetical protein